MALLHRNYHKIETLNLSVGIHWGSPYGLQGVLDPLIPYLSLLQFQLP